MGQGVGVESEMISVPAGQVMLSDRRTEHSWAVGGGRHPVLVAQRRTDQFETGPDTQAPG
ncbi:hypothetical protein ACLQ2D_28855 [Streptomyces sp. DT199]|uniref:hypothetical protein n=1 Tax=Streptomyces sp. DT199 TaxID=3393421 RepID=UPI003CE91460